MKHASWIAVAFAALIGVTCAVFAALIGTVFAAVSWIVARPLAAARRSS